MTTLEGPAGWPVGAPMSSFDPSQRCRVHDQLNDQTFDWGPFFPSAQRGMEVDQLASSTPLPRGQGPGGPGGAQCCDDQRFAAGSFGVPADSPCSRSDQAEILLAPLPSAALATPGKPVLGDAPLPDLDREVATTHPQAIENRAISMRRLADWWG